MGSWSQVPPDSLGTSGTLALKIAHLMARDIPALVSLCLRVEEGGQPPASSRLPNRLQGGLWQPERAPSKEAQVLAVGSHWSSKGKKVGLESAMRMLQFLPIYKMWTKQKPNSPKLGQVALWPSNPPSHLYEAGKMQLFGGIFFSATAPCMFLPEIRILLHPEKESRCLITSTHR